MEDLNAIIKKCCAKKAKAQKLIYQMFAKKMFGVCLRYAKDYTEAEDILHDGFIKVFEKIELFKYKGSFEGWIRRIMVNTALERLRKQSILYPVNDFMENSLDYSYENIIDEISTKDLLALIQDLSPKYRIVFNLYAIEGYSHQEIGEKLGIAVGTSKSNLSRARQILQQKVKDLYKEEPNKLKIIK